MKNLFFAFFLLLSASVLSAQQLAPIEHTRDNHVHTDRAKEALYFFALPGHLTMPAYVPDSVKSRSLFMSGNNLYKYNLSNHQFVLVAKSDSATRHYIDSLLPAGLQGQIIRASGDNSRQYTASDPLIYGNFVYTDDQLTAAMSRGKATQYQIFKNFYRYSHGGSQSDPTGQAQNNYIPGQPSQTNSWTYDTLANKVTSTYNSGSAIGLVSRDKYDHYVHTVTVGANDGTTPDNDRIGVEIAFVQGPDSVSNNAYGLNPADFTWPVDVTSPKVLNEHSLTLFVNRDDTTLSYFIVYDYKKTTQKTIANGSAQAGLWKTLSNWAGNSVDLKVIRSGDTITTYRSQFSDAPGGKGSLAYPLTVNLNSDPVLAKFKGKQSYGYAAQSQEAAFYSNISFSASNNTIYDLRNRQVYVYRDTGYAVDPTKTIYTENGQRFFFRDTSSQSFGYMRPPDGGKPYDILAGSNPDQLIVFPDTASFATYSGPLKIAVLKDPSVGGGTPFLKAAKGSDVANGGTRFTSNQADSLWYRQFSGPINLLWFGAKGDYNIYTHTGSDNADRLQAAVNEDENKSTSVYIPNTGKPFGMSHEIKMGQATLIEGDNSLFPTQLSGSDTLKYQTKSAIVFYNNTNGLVNTDETVNYRNQAVQTRHLAIISSYPGNTGAGIRAWSNTNATAPLTKPGLWKVEDVNISGFHTAIDATDGDSFYALFSHFSEAVTGVIGGNTETYLFNNDYYNITDTAAVLRGRNDKVIGGEFEPTTTTGVSISMRGNKAAVMGASFKKNKNAIVVRPGSYGNIVEGNTFLNTYNDVIKIDSLAGQIKVVNNDFETDNLYVSGYILNASGADHVEWINNTVRKTSGGISGKLYRFSNCTNITFMNPKQIGNTDRVPLYVGTNTFEPIDFGGSDISTTGGVSAASFKSPSGSTAYFGTTGGNTAYFGYNSLNKWKVDPTTSGDFMPANDNTNNVGGSSNRIARAYLAGTTNQLIDGTGAYVSGIPSATTIPALKLTSSQTTVSGSTSGSATFVELATGTPWKKVLIYCNALVGTASYTYPTAFSHTGSVFLPYPFDASGWGFTVTSSTTGCTVGFTTAYTGFITIEGN
ncbi:MAG TPA: hypothetical protein VHA56_16085 [Mucilaginibacter sp.]|nr:hypothetical protein [Mucilaginibacter sp.]